MAKKIGLPKLATNSRTPESSTATDFRRVNLEGSGL